MEFFASPVNHILVLSTSDGASAVDQVSPRLQELDCNVKKFLLEFGKGEQLLQLHVVGQLWPLSKGTAGSVKQDLVEVAYRTLGVWSHLIFLFAHFGI